MSKFLKLFFCFSKSVLIFLFHFFVLSLLLSAHSLHDYFSLIAEVIFVAYEVREFLNVVAFAKRHREND